MNTAFHFLLVLLAFMFLCCKSGIKINEEDFLINVAIYQNGKEYLMNIEDSISIEKKKFAIRFNNKRYDQGSEKLYRARIATLKTKAELDRVKAGEITEDSLLFFFPGTDMTPYEDNFYRNLNFTDMAHTSLYYENENNRRVKLLSDNKDYLRLEFEVDSFILNEDPTNFNEPAVHISEMQKETIYIAVFIDKNLNGKIEKGEYSKITLHFKP